MYVFSMIVHRFKSRDILFADIIFLKLYHALRFAPYCMRMIRNFTKKMATVCQQRIRFIRYHATTSSELRAEFAKYEICRTDYDRRTLSDCERFSRYGNF